MKKCPLSYMRTAGGAHIACFAIIVSKKIPTSSRSPPQGVLELVYLSFLLFQFLNQGFLFVITEGFECENGLVTDVILDIKHKSNIREFVRGMKILISRTKSSQVIYLDGLSEFPSGKYHKKTHP